MSCLYEKVLFKYVYSSAENDVTSTTSSSGSVLDDRLYEKANDDVEDYDSSLPGITTGSEGDGVGNETKASDNFDLHT